MSDQALATIDEAPALVVFGLDETGKAHASTFTVSEVQLATKAAALMGMKAMPVKTDADQALAAKLPRGRVFASGKGFVPFVKAGLYAELEAAAPADAVVPTLSLSEADIVEDGEELDDAALLTSEAAINIPEAVPSPMTGLTFGWARSSWPPPRPMKAGTSALSFRSRARTSSSFAIATSRTSQSSKLINQTSG